MRQMLPSQLLLIAGDMTSQCHAKVEKNEAVRLLKIKGRKQHLSKNEATRLLKNKPVTKNHRNHEFTMT